MRVVLSAGKRGHYYLTARALEDRGVLSRFVTSTFFSRHSWRRRFFPKKLVANRSDARLADENVLSLWPVEMAYRAVRPLCGRFRRTAMHAYNTAYDWASIPFVVGRGDVLHVANTYAVRSGAAAKRRGMRVVVDQQLVHPQYLTDVVEAEYRSLGVSETVVHPPTRRRIVRELELADLILVPSRFVLEENVRYGIPGAKQRVVPFGVDTTLFSPSTRRRAVGDRFRVLFVGGINARKGVGYLLEAVKRLDDPRVEVQLVGALAPSEKNRLAPYADLFEHVPTISHEQLAETYRDADAFCLPSIAEGSALVSYEAMASALPCVVTRSTGSIGEHEKNVLVVPIRSPEAIADALRRLMDDPEFARRLGRAARAAACECDLRHYGRRLVEAYEDFFQKQATS